MVATTAAGTLLVSMTLTTGTAAGAAEGGGAAGTEGAGEAAQVEAQLAESGLDLELDDADTSYDVLEQLEQPEADSPEADNEFYVPPEPLPDGEPGDVIRAEPYEPKVDPLGIGTFPAESWRVMYLSTDALGEPMAVTGTVMVPEADWEGEGERPLVSYAIGTHGLGSHCAPSVGLEQGLDYEAAFMKEVVDDGNALVVPDYEGLGTPDDHTYMVGSSQGAAVLDALRAATDLDEADELTGETPMGITGFSQGGGAAVWAGQMHPEYAPELPLEGVAAGGVPADLDRVAENIDGGLYFTFLAFAAHGYNAAYPELPLEEHLNARGEFLFEKVSDGCMVDTLPLGVGKSMDDLLEIDLIGTPEWQARLEENKPGGTAPEAPLYLYHSTGDDVIPVDQAEEMRDAYCEAGATLEWHENRSGPHITSFLLDSGDARAWLGEQFAGEEAESDC
ncbi:lipase family protein [Nocardiopsis salina]